MTYLQFLRLSKGKKAKEVANYCGVKPAHLSMIEKGLRTPSYDVQCKLAHVYGMKRKDIFPYFPYK